MTPYVFLIHAVLLWSNPALLGPQASEEFLVPVVARTPINQDRLPRAAAGYVELEESLDNILLEDGSGSVLLESSAVISPRL